MKLNWGTGIAIFYSVFVVIMISMVVKSFSHKSHLVMDNYYQRDLGYEEHRSKKENAAKLTEEITVSYDRNSNSLFLNFPKSMSEAKGDLHLFRPSNKFLDQSYPMRLNSIGQSTIAMNEKPVSGLWTIKMDWTRKGVDYYKELTLVI